MYCEHYVDFTRLCQHKIGSLEVSNYEFCTTSKHKDCPFYKVIHKIGYHCKHLELHPAFDHFQAHNFEEFVRIANDYCLSRSNNKNCARFKLRQKGKEPPKNLQPDGSVFKEEPMQE